MAIRVAHHLQEKKIPAYFVSVRGMESKEDLVSKLLSMFADDKQVGHISSSHFSIKCLQQVQNPFVLIFDNADDLLESGDTKRKEHVLQFIYEILTHCKQIKLLLTTRESLDYLKHKLPMYSEKINVLDKISSEDLVRLLLPDASDDDYNSIVRVCGNVAMSMRLLCSIIKEESISIHVLLQELNNSTLVEVLDSSYLPDSVRIKSVINTSFKRLMVRERDAFVSLSVFPEWFGVEEAQAILNEKSEVQTKQIIRSLERKSLIDCGENFSHFTVHSLFRSFIQEETKNDQAVEAVFRESQIQFYDYYISRCKVANEHFQNERYGDAFRDFVDRRSSIISSLSSGPRIDRIYSKVVELLSEAKSFLSVALHEEQMLLERLYETAVEEANTRGNLGDKQMLRSARGCHTAESFFWLSRVQREEGNLKEAKKSARVGSQIRKELLGHSPNRAVSFYHRGVAYKVMGDNDTLVKAFQKAKDVANLPQPSYYNVPSTGASSKKYHEGYMGGLQYEAYMRLHLDGVNKETASCFLLLARKQLEAENLTGALESLKVHLQLRQELSGGHSNTADHFYEQGTILFAMGDFTSAVEAFQKAAELNFNLCRDHIKTARSYLSLGTAQKKIQDHEGALDSLQKALCMQSHLLGDHEHTAHNYHKLGLVQRDMGDLKGALDSLHKAANMRLSVLGNHEDTASSFFELGVVQKKAGDLKSALESVQVSLRLREELLGDSPKTADSLYEKGNLHCIMGDSKSAVGALQKAADINFNFRKDHINTARNYHSLGIAQELMGEHEGALDSLQKAACMQSNLLGDHEDTASSYHKLGLVQRDMGDLKGALDSLHKAANMRLSVLGNHEDTASSFFELGVVQKKAGDLKSALESVQVSLRLREELLGDSPKTADSLYEKGNLHCIMGDSKSAVGALQKAADINFNFRKDHINTARNYHSLGIAQELMGEHEGALDSLQKAACMQSNLLGDHEDTASSYHDLGLVQRAMEDLKKALDSLQKAANMRSTLLGDHKDTASSYHELGVVQHGMGDLKGALKSLQKALDMRTNLFGDHGDTMSSLNELHAVQKKFSSGRSCFGKVFRRKNRHENNDNL